MKHLACVCVGIMFTVIGWIVGWLNGRWNDVDKTEGRA